MSCSAPSPSTQPRDPAGTPQVVELRAVPSSAAPTKSRKGSSAA